MKTAQEIINKCFVEGNTIKVPTEQADRKAYVEFKNILTKNGGKWNKLWKKLLRQQ